MSRITMIMITLCIMLTLLGIGLFYVGRKFFCWLCLVLPGVNPKLYIIVPVIVVLSFALAFMPLDLHIKKYLVRFNWLFMGVFLYCLMFFVLSDIVLLIGKLLRVVPAPTPQSFVIVTGWIVLVSVAGLATYGIYNGYQLKHVAYTVQIKKETPLDKLHVVLIADTHLGYQNSAQWLATIVDTINAVKPDIVILAGDIFNDNFRALPHPEEAVRSLQSIVSTYGVYACLGNHDGGHTYHEMLDFLEQGNVTVLQDEYVVIEDKFILLGRTELSPIRAQGEPRRELQHVLEGIDVSMPIIVIDHTPASIREYGSEIDLILAGHTHGGQMFPANFITRRVFDVDYGYYQKDADSPHVIVTPGVGIWGPPFRIGTNNEIVSIWVKFE